MNNNLDPIRILDIAHQLGLKISNIDYVARYIQIEKMVSEHIRIQTLLTKLKATDDETSYNILYDELHSIPIFSEYIELQTQVENYLKDLINILVKAVSPNISLKEKHDGGCGNCTGCNN
jgi:cell fate (sporulation/competence/biofilm development) regulator YmcA (YheA/YmcA/DUF963 family)